MVVAAAVLMTLNVSAPSPPVMLSAAADFDEGIVAGATGELSADVDVVGTNES